MNKAFREHCIAVLLFVFLAILMTLPVIFHMQSGIAGTGGDPWQTMWRFTEKGQGGFSAFLHDISGTGDPQLVNLSVWPWMPLHLLFGQPFAYNLIWLLHFVLSGYAMALLIQVLTDRKSILHPAPLLAGIAYMALPYHTAQALGHFGAMQLEWIPFICVAAIVFFKSPTVGKAILLGALLTIQAWVEHHYLVWIGIFGVIAWFVYRKELPPLRKLPSSILALILILGILIPFIPTIRLATGNEDAIELGIEQTIRFSADLFSFITPPPSHPIWGGVSHSLFGQYFTGNESESVQYLGISILLAIIFFHKHIPVKQKRLWITTAVVFAILSLGPVLHVFGKETSLPLPYALLANLPVFSAIRVISRTGVMVSFATVVLFGWVIATNIHKTRTSYIIGAIVILDFLFVPFPFQSAVLSPVYAAIQDMPGSSIIEIPAATNYAAASRSLYASSLHGKQVLGNIALERGEDPDAYTLVKSMPGVRQLLYLRTTELSEQRNEFFDQNLLETLPDAMTYLDAHAVIVHTDSLSEVQNKAIEDFFNASPTFTSKSFGDVTLYTAVSLPEENHTDGIVIARHEGWENIGYDPKKQSVFGEVPVNAGIDIINVLNEPREVTLTFVVPQDSPDDVAVKDTNGVELLRAKKGEGNSFTVLVNPGITSVTFSSVGEGKAIIQDPDMQVKGSGL